MNFEWINAENVQLGMNLATAIAIAIALVLAVQANIKIEKLMIASQPRPEKPVERPGLSDSYIDRDDLMKAIGIGAFGTEVWIDGQTVHNGAKPAARYFTQANGSISKELPTEIVVASTTKASVLAAAGMLPEIDGAEVKNSVTAVVQDPDDWTIGDAMSGMATMKPADYLVLQGFDFHSAALVYEAILRSQAPGTKYGQFMEVWQYLSNMAGPLKDMEKRRAEAVYAGEAPVASIAPYMLGALYRFQLQNAKNPGLWPTDVFRKLFSGTQEEMIAAVRTGYLNCTTADSLNFGTYPIFGQGTWLERANSLLR